MVGRGGREGHARRLRRVSTPNKNKKQERRAHTAMRAYCKHLPRTRRAPTCRVERRQAVGARFLRKQRVENRNKVLPHTHPPACRASPGCRRRRRTPHLPPRPPGGPSSCAGCGPGAASRCRRSRASVCWWAGRWARWRAKHGAGGRNKHARVRTHQPWSSSDREPPPAPAPPGGAAPCNPTPALASCRQPCLPAPPGGATPRATRSAPARLPRGCPGSCRPPGRHTRGGGGGKQTSEIVPQE